tara:strand:- start:2848 stop:3300 length:453 start_codon:yes stop_codon:yes gene_type:complete
LNKKEIIDFLSYVASYYPKQKPFNQAQTEMFMVALCDPSLTLGMAKWAFSMHTQYARDDSHWMPQVSHITKWIQTEGKLRAMFKDMTQRKDPKDATATKIWNQLGGGDIGRMPVELCKKIEDQFVFLYQRDTGLKKLENLGVQKVLGHKK